MQTNQSSHQWQYLKIPIKIYSDGEIGCKIKRHRIAGLQKAQYMRMAFFRGANIKLQIIKFDNKKVVKQQGSIKPNLLKDDYWMKIFYNLQEKTKKIVKQSVLIYQGTKDGLNGQQFWNKVNDKCNLLMVFQSKTDYIFGAYSPCKWEQNRNNYVQDDTLSSFIFSQTHDQVYPLKSDYKQYAIYCHSSYGPRFGGGHDIRIDGNFTDGHCKLGHSYQFNQYKNGSEDPYLFGQNKPEIKECEIYQLSFL